jgi:pimeloyl-ACP methyl ester carboxylesterase
MLLDRIGPAIVQTHSAGGPFGWLTADERPNLVKAIVCFEGAGDPLVRFGANIPAATLPNLKGIPVLYFVADNSGLDFGQPIVEALKQSGAAAEYLNLRDRGIRGNSHFAMLEANRREVFDVFRTWVEGKVDGGSRQTARA